MLTEYPNSKDILLVPMKIESLVVGEESAEYTDVSANFRLLDGGQEAAVYAPIFSKSENLEKGVHLHWLLPDAFTNGVEDENTGQINYPAAPDRWLITRIAVNSKNVLDTTVNVKSFFVESNYISKKREEENLYSISFPYQNSNGDLSFVYLGRSGVVGYRKEGGKYLDEITAIGYGDVAFAAMYQCCRNVFGFYDDLKDIEEGNITYQICGWFSNADKDPLQSVKSEYDFQERLKQLNWKFSIEESNEQIQSEFCNKTVCHGTICGIEWKGRHKQYSTGIPEKSFDVAIGNSSNEAFSALLHKNKNQKLDERIIQILVGNLMDDWLKEDSMIEAEERVHQEMFESVNGGNLYFIKLKETFKSDNSKSNKPELSWEVAKSLDMLNREQENLEQLLQMEKERIKDIYFRWYRYITKYNSQNLKPDEKSRWYKQIEQLLNQFVENKKNICVCKNKIQTLLDELNLKIPTEYEVHICSKERYYIPNEPVLLFAGQGLESDFNKSKSSGVEEDGCIMCRTLGQLINFLPIPKDFMDFIETDIKVYYNQISTYIEDWHRYSDEYRLILGETLLLSTDFAPVILIEFLKNRKRAISEENINNGLKKLIEIQKSPYNALLDDKNTQKTDEDVQKKANSLGFRGIFPAKIGWRYYYPAWNPLFMEWEMAYYPDSDSVNDEKNGRKKPKRWKLEKLDFELNETIGYDRNYGKYRERMLLTPHFLHDASKSLNEAIELIDKQNKLISEGEQTYSILQQAKQVLLYIKNTDILSQKLSGFTEYLLSEKQTMLLPVEYQWKNDELMQKLLTKNFDSTQLVEFIKLVDQEISTIPYINGTFYPIRAGFGELTGMRILDTFGRILTVCDESNYKLQARAIALSEDFRSDLDNEKIFFPPRIMQSARIRGKFVSVKDEDLYTNEIPATTPVFGWLMPEFQDGGLWAFDGSGKVLGKFLTVTDRKGCTKIIFMVSPSDAMGTVPEERYKIPNNIGDQLYECLKGILDSMNEKVGSNPEVLYQFVNYLCFEITNMGQNPTAEKETGIWTMGKPLALVKFKICLEIKEEISIPGGSEPEETKGKGIHPLINKRFPIYIGDKRKKEDGLAGFFRVQNKYKKFYTDTQEYSSKNSFMCDNISAYLNCGQPQEFIALMNPILPFHIISGILPVKKLQIPEVCAVKQIEKIDVELFVSPILTDYNKLQIPIRTVQNKKWIWIKVNEGVYEIQTELNDVSDHAYEASTKPYICEGWLKQVKDVT